MKSTRPQIAIIGSALSGNKGAAAMLESAVQTLTERFPDAEFTLLSMYPAEDRKQNPYKKFEEIGNIIEVILLETAKKYNVALTVNRFGSMLNPFFVTTGEVTNFVEAQLSDTDKFAVFFWEMIKNGVFLPPSQFEAWFLSSALTDKNIKVIAEAIDKGMLAVSKM